MDIGYLILCCLVFPLFGIAGLAAVMLSSQISRKQEAFEKQESEDATEVG